jgi:CheY-like chemotaxis protein
VLLDWRLPVMNGWDFYVELRKHHRTRNVPVVVMTGYPEETEALPNWVFRLRKPLEVATLLEVVAREIR